MTQQQIMILGVLFLAVVIVFVSLAIVVSQPRGDSITINFPTDDGQLSAFEMTATQIAIVNATRIFEIEATSTAAIAGG